MALESYEKKIAKQALLEWWLSKRPLDRVFYDVLREHRVGANQRSAVAAVVYNYVRYLGLLMPRPVQPESPPWQRAFEESLAKAVASPEALLAQHGKAKPSVAADPAKHFAEMHLLPGFLAKEFAVAPKEWHDYLHASLLEAPLFIRINPLKITAPEFLKRYEKHEPEPSWLPGCFRFPSRWAVVQDPGFLDGLFEIQDEHSQLVAWVGAPRPGERVLDLCAGAGGKTLQLAALLENKGEVVAYDVEKRKLGELSSRAKRAGLTNVRASESLPKKDSGFDLVVVDAPCSGLGTIRRNPDRLYSLCEPEIQRLARVQVEITDRALDYLKPGGRLVYATCTLRPQENELIVKRLMEAKGLKLVSAPAALEASLRAAGAGAAAANFLASARAAPAWRLGEAFSFGDSAEFCLHLGPASQASGGPQGDGFFVALLH